jgi:hypothetical protein
MKTLALKVATIVVLVVGAQAVVADCGQIDDDPNSVIISLCRSKDAEGGYDWKLDGEAARIWVVCQSETRVLPSINTLDSNYTLTMVHTAINRRNPELCDLRPVGGWSKNCQWPIARHSALEHSGPAPG